MIEDVIGPVIGFAIIGLWLLMAYAVAKDARRRGSKWWGVHTIATFMVGIGYLIPYYLFKNDPIDS